MWVQAAEQVRAGSSRTGFSPASPIALCSRRGFPLFPWVLSLRSSSWFLTHVTDMPKTQPLFFFFWGRVVVVYVCHSPLEIPTPWNRSAARIFTLMVQRTPLQKAPLLFLSLIQLPSIAFCLYFPLLVDSLITRRRVGAGAGKKHLNKADCKAEVGWLWGWRQGILPPEPNFDHKL